MAARKRTTKKPVKKDEEEEVEEVYYVAEGDEEDGDGPLPTNIETEVMVDAIEFHLSDDPKAEPTYHVSFHADLPEHIAQHLFAHHVQEGRITVEFQPADPALRRRGTLVRR